jgi:hypothetical protein
MRPSALAFGRCYARDSSASNTGDIGFAFALATMLPSPPQPLVESRAQA